MNRTHILNQHKLTSSKKKRILNRLKKLYKVKRCLQDGLRRRLASISTWRTLVFRENRNNILSSLSSVDDIVNLGNVSKLMRDLVVDYCNQTGLTFTNVITRDAEYVDVFKKARNKLETKTIPLGQLSSTNLVDHMVVKRSVDYCYSHQTFLEHVHHITFEDIDDRDDELTTAESSLLESFTYHNLTSLSIYKCDISPSMLYFIDKHSDTIQHLSIVNSRIVDDSARCDCIRLNLKSYRPSRCVCRKVLKKNFSSFWDDFFYKFYDGYQTTTRDRKKFKTLSSLKSLVYLSSSPDYALNHFVLHMLQNIAAEASSQSGSNQVLDVMHVNDKFLLQFFGERVTIFLKPFETNETTVRLMHEHKLDGFRCKKLVVQSKKCREGILKLHCMPNEVYREGVHNLTRNKHLERIPIAPLLQRPRPGQTLKANFHDLCARNVFESLEFDLIDTFGFFINDFPHVFDRLPYLEHLQVKLCTVFWSYLKNKNFPNIKSLVLTCPKGVGCFLAHFPTVRTVSFKTSQRECDIVDFAIAKRIDGAFQLENLSIPYQNSKDIEKFLHQMDYARSRLASNSASTQPKLNVSVTLDDFVKVRSNVYRTLNIQLHPYIPNTD